MTGETTPLIGSTGSAGLKPFPNPALLWKTGSVLVTAGIVAGAFGAHAIKQRVTPSQAESWSTASHYAIYGGLGLLGMSLHPRFAYHRFAGPALALGTVIFSGSIMGLVLDKDKKFRFLGPITPMGGLLMMAGFFAMAF